MPKLKQFGDKYSSIFQDASVVSAYQHRAPYPIATFDHLVGLMDKSVSPRRILDVGCGRGEISSMLLHAADGIDAVDISAAMIGMGRKMPYGSDERINWINGAIEQVELNPPYALMVAAASIHWMDWEATLSRLAAALSNDGYLAIVETRLSPNAWDKELSPILAHYSMNQDFEPYNMLTVAAELQRRGLFEQHGVIEVEPVLHRQRINNRIEAIHAGNGFSRDRMEEEIVREFDRKVRDVLVRHCPQGEVEQWVGARLIYGKPLAQGE
jgi:2-polyprenyl-3-methyl-5-hydroxy-6-metoxy-1,4-benzoquinol methylase